MGFDLMHIICFGPAQDMGRLEKLIIKHVGDSVLCANIAQGGERIGAGYWAFLYVVRCCNSAAFCPVDWE